MQGDSFHCIGYRGKTITENYALPDPSQLAPYLLSPDTYICGGLNMAEQLRAILFQDLAFSGSVSCSLSM